MASAGMCRDAASLGVQSKCGVGKECVKILRQTRRGEEMAKAEGGWRSKSLRSPARPKAEAEAEAERESRHSG